MAETTNISKLIINYLTEDQYKTAKASGLINENELYVTDVQDSTTLDCFEELFTATEGQTLFTLIEGTYVPNQSRLTICVNGTQQPSTAYTETSSSSFTFDSGLSAGDSVIARYVNARIVSNIALEPHKSTHYSGGIDPLTPSDIGAATSTHTHGNITNGGTVGSTPNLPIFTGESGLLETKSIEDAQTLLGMIGVAPHKSTHSVGGSDALIDSDIGLTPAVATALGLTSTPQVKDALSKLSNSVINGGKLADPTRWEEHTLAGFSNYGRIGYDEVNNIYLALGTNNAHQVVLYSSNGLDWSFKSLPSNSNWTSIAVGHGRYLVSGHQTGTPIQTKLAYSTDGLNWTSISSPGEGTQYNYEVAYGDGKILAVNSVTGKVFEYTEAKTWLQVGSVPVAIYSILVYANDRFILMPNGHTSGRYSTNGGVSWSATNFPTNPQPWYGVAYGNGKYVAVSSSSISTAAIAISTNGTSWNFISASVSQVYGIAFGDGYFVVVTNGGVHYSIDGLIWITSTVTSVPQYMVVFDTNVFLVLNSTKLLRCLEKVLLTDIFGSYLGEVK